MTRTLKNGMKNCGQVSEDILVRKLCRPEDARGKPSDCDEQQHHAGEGGEDPTRDTGITPCQRIECQNKDCQTGNDPCPSPRMPRRLYLCTPHRPKECPASGQSHERHPGHQGGQRPCNRGRPICDDRTRHTDGVRSQCYGHGEQHYDPGPLGQQDLTRCSLLMPIRAESADKRQQGGEQGELDAERADRIEGIFGKGVGGLQRGACLQKSKKKVKRMASPKTIRARTLSFRMGTILILKAVNICQKASKINVPGISKVPGT